MVAIVRDGIEFDELTGVGGEARVVLDRTPFYGEGGGQVGDRGALRESGGGSPLFDVEDTQKPVGGLIVHRGRLHGRLRVGRDGRGGRGRGAARANTMRNHTGHAPAPPRAPQRRGPARPAGGLARHARLPAVRLPARPAAHRGGEARGSRPRCARSSARTGRCRSPPGDARGDRAGRGRHLRREVRRDVRTSTSRATAWSCAAARTAARPARSAGSSSPPSVASVPGMRRIEAMTGDGADALVAERFRRSSRRRDRLGAIVGRGLLPDRVAELAGRGAGGEAPPPCGGGAGMPKAEELVAGGARGRRPASGSSRSPAPFESMDAMKGVSKEVRAAHRLRRHRARARSRDAERLGDRERRPRRRRRLGRLARAVDGRPHRGQGRRAAGDGAGEGIAAARASGRRSTRRRPSCAPGTGPAG